MSDKAIQCCGINFNQWNKIKKNLLKSRNSFEYELFKIILANELCLVPKIETVLFFPGELTIKDRARIHIFSIKNCISSTSVTRDDQRFLRVELTPEYTREMISKFLKLI